MFLCQVMRSEFISLYDLLEQYAIGREHVVEIKRINVPPQVAPVNQSGQAQWKMPLSEVQLPPFLQGIDVQGSGSRSNQSMP